MQVAIIGGGVTGLAAAYELSLRGIPFVLLEQSARLGGLVRTEHVEGCTIDAGADSMLATKPAAIALCEELGLGGQLMSQRLPRTAFVYARGSLHQLPSPSVFGIPTTPEALASYTLLPPTARVELESRRSLELDSKRRSGAAGDDPGDESVADFFTRHFGAETVSLIAEPLLGGIHSGDITKLSIDSVAPAFATRVRAGQLFAATPQPAPANARPPGADAGDGMFKALRGGMGGLVSAIESRLPANSVRLASGACSLAQNGNAWRVGYDGGNIDAAALVLACPTYAAAGLLQPIDPALADLCAEVPYASTVSVALVWPRGDVQHALAGSGFVVARRHSALRITACTWVSSKWEDRAGPGHVLLRAFLGGIPDPEAVKLSDDELIEIAVRDLATVLNTSAPPRTAKVYHWIRAGAQHNVGHGERLKRIESRLQMHAGVFVAGSGFRSIGIPDCVADGRAVAQRVAEYVGLKSAKEVNE